MQIAEPFTTLYLEHIFRLDKTKSFVSGLEIVESLTHVALANKFDTQLLLDIKKSQG